MLKLIADMFPAAVTPRPPEVPVQAKLRVVLAEDRMVIAWLAGRDANNQPIVASHTIALDPSMTASATHLGGQVGDYTLTRGSGCSCGSAGLKNWQPFGDEPYSVVSRTLPPAPTNGVTSYSRA